MLAPHLHNRPHSHVAASLLVSLGREPIRVQLAGHWITAEAVWAAPDVDQALDSDGPVAVLHLDPDHRAWRALTLWRDGMSLTDLALAAGFYDQPHLNRTLRAMFDTLPSRYARAFPIQVEHLDEPRLHDQ